MTLFSPYTISIGIFPKMWEKNPVYEFHFFKFCLRTFYSASLFNKYECIFPPLFILFSSFTIQIEKNKLRLYNGDFFLKFLFYEMI